MMVWFETILVVLTALSGLVWLLDKLVLAKRRAVAAGPLEPARHGVPRGRMPAAGYTPGMGSPRVAGGRPPASRCEATPRKGRGFQEDAA